MLRRQGHCTFPCRALAWRKVRPLARWPVSCSPDKGDPAELKSN
jgi:hypothetical protein